MQQEFEPRRVAVSEARALLERDAAVLLDARDSRLYDNAHIQGARSLPLGVLTAAPGPLASGVLPEHPGLFLFYCA